MWSVVTEPLDLDPNPPLAGPVEPGRDRWFWSADAKKWTRSVSARTYYTTRKDAEAGAAEAVLLHAHLIGKVQVMSAVDIHLETHYKPKKDDDDIPF